MMRGWVRVSIIACVVRENCEGVLIWCVDRVC